MRRTQSDERIRDPARQRHKSSQHRSRRYQDPSGLGSCNRLIWRQFTVTYSVRASVWFELIASNFQILNDDASSAITDFMQDRAMLTAAYAPGRGIEIDN
jgi:hypothetical protein